jgi:thymidine kinase
MVTGLQGRIEVLTGPMFSGKTAYLILRIAQAQAVGQHVQIFKPTIDHRAGSGEVHSQLGLTASATAVSSVAELLAQLKPETLVVGIDEAQFFEQALSPTCALLADRGLRIIIAGLDMDFRGEPFGAMPELMARAEEITKLTARCTTCSEPASLTQRLVNGLPAAYDDPTIIVGSVELYEARCRGHHTIQRPRAELVTPNSSS